MRSVQNFLFCTAFVIGLLFSCSARSQEVQSAIQKFFARPDVENPFARIDGFDPNSFNPKHFEPLLLEAQWENVRVDLVKAIRDVEGVPHYLRDLDEVEQRARVARIDSWRLTLDLVPNEGASSYRILFIESSPTVRKALAKSLSLPGELLLDPQDTFTETPATYVVVSSFKDKFLTNGLLNLHAIAQATTRFANERNGVLNGQSMAVSTTHVDKKMTAVTTWKNLRRTSKDDFYWRAYFSVHSDGERQDTWIVTAKVLLGRKSPSSPPTSIKIFEDFDKSTRYASLFNRNILLRGGPQFIPTSRSSVLKNSPAGASPLMKLQTELFSGLEKTLVREP